MSWYTTALSASLIDQVQVGSYTGDQLTIYVANRRYRYNGVSGSYLANQISQWKKWKNKRVAGQKMSALMRNLEQHREQDLPQPQQQKPTQNAQPNLEHQL